MIPKWPPNDINTSKMQTISQNDPEVIPEWYPNHAKMMPHAKMIPKWSENNQRDPQMIPNCCQMQKQYLKTIANKSQNDPQMIPKWFPNARMIPKWSQSDPQMIAKLRQRQIWYQNERKLIPKWSPSELKMTPVRRQGDPTSCMACVEWIACRMSWMAPILHMSCMSSMSRLASHACHPKCI